ncbi:MAG: hypothetical protein NC041_07160 [Bacteroides sp.]|nr:hypothetical protein [Prevotella sp.]MCM1407076.1 hypothetical protein [Treponema brennaborense]MCM1470228.1 hypothetical protein [Bacteroides sp.]
MKKYILISFLAVFGLPVFCELPKVEANAESVIVAFQELTDAFLKTGNTNLDVDWRSKELELKAYSDQLALNYETVRRYVEQIEQAKNKVEESGMLSKTELADFKKSMESNFSVQYWDIEHYDLPETLQPVYTDPNIKILENNAKVHQSNIETAQKLLDEMQTPLQIQEIITKEHAELESLKSAKKKNTKRITELENHAIQLGLAYGTAVGNEKKYKQIISDNTDKLNAIPVQIQKYKEAADSEYKKEFMRQIANINTWIDFFNGKNETIRQYLQILDTKNAMQTKLDNVVPMEEVRNYQARLDDFIESWKL